MITMPLDPNPENKVAAAKPIAEKIPAKKPAEPNLDFDLPADLQSAGRFSVLDFCKEHLTYFGYAAVLLAVLLGLIVLNDSSVQLEGQLIGQDAVSTVADEDALSRFASDDISSDPEADESAENEIEIPPPPSLINNAAPESPEAQNLIEISASDFKFDKTEINLLKGEPVTIKFSVSSGSHSFVIDEVVESAVLSAGESEELTFTVDEDAELTFYCGLHPMMTGKAIVAGSDQEIELGAEDADLSSDIDALLGEDAGADADADAAAVEPEVNDDFSQSEVATNDSLRSNTQSQVLDSQSVMGNSGPEGQYLLLIFVLSYLGVLTHRYVSN